MQADEFANATMGALSERAKKFIGDLKFETAKPSLIQKLFNKTNNDIAVISVDDLVGSLGEEASNAIGMTKETLKTKAEAMSKALQPAKNGKMLLTRQQVSDLFKDGSINSSEFMGEIYGSKFKELLNPNKFISIKKITKFRNNMDDYLNAMADYAKKKNNGEVTAELIEKFSKSSFVKSAAFRGTAILISALCLGIAIPKLQYAITKKRTGNDKAPGLREYENSGNTKENNTQKA